MKKKLQISPLDPILVRDGRPFDRVPGVRAHTLNNVLPSTFAGGVRTALVKKEEDPLQKDLLKKLDIRGPLYRVGESLYFPTPLDIEWYEKESDSQNKKAIAVHRVAPQSPTQVCSKHSGFLGIGKEGLLEDKLWLPIGSGKNKKLKATPAYVSQEWMLSWLTESLSEEKHVEQLQTWLDNDITPSETDNLHSPLFMKAFEKEERIHTSIDSQRYSVKEGELFSTESLVLPEGLKLEAWIEGSDGWTDGTVEPISELHTLGGKRRLVHLSEVEESDEAQLSDSFWDCPKDVTDSLKGQEYVRMVLATPAYFRRGWIPGWLDEDLVSKDSWNDKIKLQLCWSSLSRWQPVSGWAYDSRKSGATNSKLPQEKMVRRMVPAGSVYFFKVLKGDPSILAKELWLQSVSDRNRRGEAHDREDGFGLALWGSWKSANVESKRRTNL